jgi:hypothetical protein
VETPRFGAAIIGNVDTAQGKNEVPLLLSKEAAPRREGLKE